VSPPVACCRTWCRGRIPGETLPRPIPPPQPTADVVTQGWGVQVPLSSLPTGGQRIVPVGDRPAFLRALSEEKVRRVREEEGIHLPDPYSRNVNQPVKQPADFHSRSLTANRTYVVLWCLCPRRGCIPMVGEGEFGGRFCPCCRTQFDLLGRVRRGPSSWNMDIPAYELGEGNVLTIYPHGARRSQPNEQGPAWGPCSRFPKRFRRFRGPRPGGSAWPRSGRTGRA
jgi:ubiquinol-cytochrome c reductase iron-sulfur subunit